MGVVADAIATYFDERDWPTAMHADGTRVATVEGENGSWSIIVQPIEERGLLAIYSVVPAESPTERRSDVLEFISRANDGLALGNFEYDHSLDIVRFKTSIDVMGIVPILETDATLMAWFVADLLATNVTTTDQYLPALLSVIDGSTSAASAVAWAESDAAT